MDKLWTYIVETLQQAGVNTVLQEDYLTNVAHDLITYLIVKNLLWVIIWLWLLISAIIIFVKYNKRDKDEEDGFSWDYDWFLLILLIVFLLVFWSVLIWINAEILLQVTIAPDIAIINYLK